MPESTMATDATPTDAAPANDLAGAPVEVRVTALEARVAQQEADIAELLIVLKDDITYRKTHGA